MIMYWLLFLVKLFFFVGVLCMAVTFFSLIHFVDQLVSLPQLASPTVDQFGDIPVVQYCVTRLFDTFYFQYPLPMISVIRTVLRIYIISVLLYLNIGSFSR